MRILIHVLLAVALPLAAGCGRTPEGRREKPAAAANPASDAERATAAGIEASVPTGTSSPAQADAAALDVEMCSEHGVPEAMCTKCHPKLIALFQAKGDWCAEHGFPESVCPICRSESGGPAIASAEEPPADGTKIIFKTLETARHAGIRTVKAVQGVSTGDVAATATIVPEPTRTARVNCRAAGIVRAIHADIGARVSRGTALATIGSAAVAETRSRVEAAQARARTAEAAYQREKDLFEKGISSAREVQSAEQEFQSAAADLESARAGLGIIGDADASGAYTLRAPIGGVVTARDISPGALVREDQVLFEIMDVSRLRAEIDLPERDAPLVSVGQPVLLTVDGVGREFEARIEYVAPLIDPATRTARARASLDNRDGTLRANMYARARIMTRATGAAIVIPREAVQEARGAQLVFIRLAEDAFETRRVSVEPAGDDFFAVNAGLKPGEEIVTTGSFLLKTETLKESIGAGCCDIEPPR